MALLRVRTPVVMLLVALLLALGGATTAKDATAEESPAVDEAGWRRPRPGTSWQLQLSGRLDPSVPASIYEIDMFDNNASAVAALHDRGRLAVCYFSAGSWEDWRPDAAAFPRSVLGSSNGWPGERWLDVRRLDVLKPIMEARLDQCRTKGFDAVDPDNVDGYANRTGFTLTANDQLVFNRWLAEAAHARGMSIALKNDVDQIPDLVSTFDFAVNEECMVYRECDRLLPFVRAGKAVLHVEYDVRPKRFCAETARLGFSSIRKQKSLAAWRYECA